MTLRKPRLSSLPSSISLLIGIALVASLPLGSAFAEDAKADGAESFFANFEELNAAFDPEIADLYSDKARIVNTQRLPDGKSGRKLAIRGIDYKPMLRQAMAVRQSRGDVTSFSDVSYASEGDRVRISCTRLVELRDFSSPYSLLVGPNDDGQWMIYEEVSETLAK